MLPDTVFNNLIRTENGGWIAGDATYSIALPDGTTLWLFGDSFIGIANPDSSIAPGSHFIRNCAVLQDGESMTAQFTGTFEDPSAFVPTDVPDSAWFWPEHGLVEHDTLKIFMSEFIKTDGTPGWNFAYDGLFMAYFTFPGLEPLGVEEIMYYHQNEVMYGNQTMNVGPHTYIYGRKELSASVPYIHIARADTGHLQGGWEFYDGSDWVSDPAESDRISFEAVSQQFAIFEHDSKYILLTQAIWLSGNIHTLVADAPEGPFGNKTLIYTTPYPYPDMFTYNAYAHPQFDENNELLVSYNSNGDFWQIFSNVELYRPRFIRVPYPMIDSAFAYTGVEQHSREREAMRVFPNPFSAHTTIQFESPETGTIPLTVSDLMGRTVFMQQIRVDVPGRRQVRINLSALPPGMYICRLAGQSTVLCKVLE